LSEQQRISRHAYLQEIRHIFGGGRAIKFLVLISASPRKLGSDKESWPSLRSLSAETERWTRGTTFHMAMADRGARATQRRLSAERSEKDLRYEEILENPDIVNDGYTTYVPEYSSEEEAPTQKRVQRRPEGTPHAIGPPLMPAGTTELEDSSAPIYLKVFGDQRKPRYADIEAGTPASGPEQLPAVSSGSNVPGGTSERLCTFEIMHNWTQDLRDEEFVAIINVVKRPDKEADRMGSVRGHIGWL
jgi:hypothetical protein